MLMTSISVTSGKFSIVALSSLTAVAISLQESQREKLDRLQTGGERQETRNSLRYTIWDPSRGDPGLSAVATSEPHDDNWIHIL